MNGGGVKMLQDLLGYCKRNISKMNARDTQKLHKEMKIIVNILEKKMKGDGQYVS
jgi:hypothetical protein